MINYSIDKNNKQNVAIVVVGYNRSKSLKRLLQSLLTAVYPSENVPLVISIDCSGEELLYNYVREFEWPYGDKYVNIQEKKLGLKKHIFQCGDLTKLFKAIILLEDDLFVSRHFYTYTLKVLEKYGREKELAEISLYRNESNGYAGLPFANYQDGNDVFLMQDVSTWGQCWTEEMWSGFKEWMDNHTEGYVQTVNMPDRIKSWERAWSKYYNAYVVDTGKSVLYPNVSLTTNFSDAGEHGGDNNSVVQVNLLQSDFDYRLGEYDKLTKYDIYGNNESLYDWLGLTKKDVNLDIYGLYSLPYNKRYVLSCMILPYKIERFFALNMRPIELNVKYEIIGNGLFLYDTTKSRKTNNKKSYSKEVVPYFLKGFNMKLLLKYMIKCVPSKMVKKILR